MPVWQIAEDASLEKTTTGRNFGLKMVGRGSVNALRRDRDKMRPVLLEDMPGSI